jgi:hypothetical protein
MEIYAIVPPARPIGYKKRQLAGVKSGKICPKNRFLTVVAKVAG